MSKKIVIDKEKIEFLIRKYYYSSSVFNTESISDLNDLIKSATEIDTDQSIEEITRTELQNMFYKETGIECVNSQGEPDIDYMQWLEDKVIKGATEQDLISKAREKEKTELIIKFLERVNNLNKIAREHISDGFFMEANSLFNQFTNR